MHRRQEKNYWDKRSGRFQEGAEIKSRTRRLRSHEHVSHVQVRKDGSEYVVSYSVAKWYVEAMQKAGVMRSLALALPGSTAGDVPADTTFRDLKPVNSFVIVVKARWRKAGHRRTSSSNSHGVGFGS